MSNKQIGSYLLVAVVMTVAILAHNLPAVNADEKMDWGMCRIEFANKDELLKMVVECAEKSKFPLKLNQTLDKVKEEVKAIKDKDFDDGCFSKCLFEKANMLESGGKVATAKLADFYKGSNVSEEFLKEIKSMFESCVTESEAKFKDEKEMPCKMYTMIEVCIFSKAMDNKKQLEELCKK